MTGAPDASSSTLAEVRRGSYRGPRIRSGLDHESTHMNTETNRPPWMARALGLAAAADIVAGVVLALSPATVFSWLGLAAPVNPGVWQVLGLFVGVHGVSYALAARDPFRHWPIVTVGLLARVVVPLGFVWAATSGLMQWGLGLLIVALGAVWWVPFGLILQASYPRSWPGRPSGSSWGVWPPCCSSGWVVRGGRRSASASRSSTADQRAAPRRVRSRASSGRAPLRRRPKPPRPPPGSRPRGGPRARASS